MKQSLQKRYFAKLFANIVGLGFGVAIAIIVPRGLGPRSYGDYNFLSTTFLGLMGFFTLSTSTGFFVKLSQRQEEFGLISFYGRLNLVSIIALFIFIIGSQLLGVSKLLWIDQPNDIVYLAALFGVVSWLLQIVTQVVDAYGLTVGSEMARILQKSIGLIMITLLFVSKELTLSSYFYYNIIISIGLIVAFIWIIKRNNYSFFQSWKLQKEQIRNYIKEFGEYSRPLLLFSFVIFFCGFYDRWLLQKFGGSIEQGFFGLSNQIAAVCFLFSSAFIPLITRELSILFSNNDIQGMTHLFRRYVPLLFGITAFLACFTAVQADKVAVIFGGDQYKDAVMPVLIMSLYPIHQTYGQVTASLFFATGKTKLYSQISILFLVIGVPIIYFTLAPLSNFGLDSGATGLAIKFVSIQFIGVNVQLFYNVKFLNLRFIHFFLHQFISVGFFISIAIIAKTLINGFNIYHNNLLLNLLIAGLLYTALAGMFIYYFPVILGLKKDDIRNAIYRLSVYIKDKF